MQYWYGRGFHWLLEAVFPALQVGELGKLSLRQLQDSFELVMQVGSVRSRLKGCNIHFCLAGRPRAISRAQPELSQPVSNEECKVHWTVLKGLRASTPIDKLSFRNDPSRCDRHC